MLQWFLDKKVAAAVVENPDKLIEEEHVEVRPERLPDGVLDENVDIHLIRRYFSSDAWLLVVDAVKQKQKNPAYICKCCSRDLEAEPSIACDHCLSWSHIKCVGLKCGPKKKHWYCRRCHQS